MFTHTFINCFYYKTRVMYSSSINHNECAFFVMFVNIAYNNDAHVLLNILKYFRFELNAGAGIFSHHLKAKVIFVYKNHSFPENLLLLSDILQFPYPRIIFKLRPFLF